MRWCDIVETKEPGGCACGFSHLDEEEGAETISHADYKLEAKYDAFNQSLFDGELPQIPLSFAKLRTVGGVVHYKVLKRPTRTLIPGSMRMVINNAYMRSEKGLDGILIHEMIHVWAAAVKGEVDESHGRLFRDKAKELGAKVGFTIPLTDDVAGLDISDHLLKPIGVVVFGQNNGRDTYAIVSAKTLQANLEEVKKRYAGYVPRRNTSIRMFSIATPLWAKKAMDVPAQRNVTGALKQWYITDPALLVELVEKGTLLGEVEPQGIQER